MYCSHFGFSRQPFKITPDTSLFYSGGERGATLEAVSYAIQSGAGITKVVGEVGTGKTMLCRMLEIKLPDTVDIVYIANPGISPENILNVIAFEVGLIKTPVSKLEVMQLLQQWLLERHAQGRQVVVLIEEAQAMPLETLEEIRLLSNLETEQDKLMQIVLFGQPELDANLLKPSIRQLSERIVHSFYLGPLKKDQIRDYLNFRVHSAGYHDFGLFNDVTARQIASVSKGLLRRVNILADKSLLAAYSEGSSTVKKQHVRTAIKDSNFDPAQWKQKPMVIWSLAVLVIGLVLMGITQYSVATKQAAKAAVEKGSTSFIANHDKSAADVNIVARSEAAAQLRQSQTNQDLLSVETAVLSDIDSNVILEEKALDASPLAAATIKNKSSELTENNLLDHRLSATKHLLSGGFENNYFVQIMYVHQSSSEGLTKFLLQAAEEISLDDIYIYESKMNGKEMYGVLYKAFSNRNEARALMKGMPAIMRNLEPFVLRTTRSVRNETIKYNG